MITVTIGGTDYTSSVYDFKVSKKGEKAVDKAEVKIKRTVQPSVHTDIKIHDGSTYYFAGRVRNTELGKVNVLTCYSYGAELKDVYVNNVAFSNVSPEYIFTTLVNEHTSLTPETDDSGITIKEYTAQGYLNDIISELVKLLDWVVYTDENQKIYLKAKNYSLNSTTLRTDTNCSLPSWEEQKEEVVNWVRIIGANTLHTHTEDTQTAASGQTVFTTTYPFTKIDVQVNSNSQTPQEDYYAYGEESKIEFTSGLSAGDKVDMTITYQVPIVVEAQNDESIASYKGKKCRKLECPWLKTADDARTYANKYLETHASPPKQGKTIYRGLLYCNPGEQIQLVDTKNNTSQYYTISEVTWHYKKYKTEIVLSRAPENLNTWQAETMERIKNLERKTSTTNITQVVRTGTETYNMAW